MKTGRLKLSAWIAAGLIGFICLSAVSTPADDDHRKKGWRNHDKHHESPLRRGGDKGNETAGQMGAWLLAAANLPVALSLMIKGVNRFTPISTGVKKTLSDLNRSQKKLLMRFHYFLNPFILAIVIWHWSTSCCRSTALPEWGAFLMAGVMALGIILKLSLCPKSLRKGVHRIHTQPLVFMAIILVLTVGHAIID